MVPNNLKSRAYRKFKPKLREDFSYTCAYCETREPEAGGARAFHIDHYKPKKKFPKLICVYENLIYSCGRCNEYKDDYWPSYMEWLNNKIILNPRTLDFPDHIDKSSAEWAGLTNRGNWNISFLHLSDKDQVQRRQDRKNIEKIIEKITNEQKEYIEFKNKASASDTQDIEEKIQDFDATIQALRRKIEGPME